MIPIKRRQEISFVIKELLKRFPEKYKETSKYDRIKNLKNISIDEFKKDIEDILNDSGLEFNNIEVIPPGRKLSLKAKSDKYNTIHINLKDPTRKDFGIVLTGLSGINTTSTVFKEGMVCYFFSTEKIYSPFKKNKNEENYYIFLENIIEDIEINNIKGVEEKEVIEILNFLKNKLEEEYDLDFLNSIFNSMSIGNWLRNSKFFDYEIHRDKIFKDIKRTGSYIANIPEDKWCPMDIILIKRGGEQQIREILDKVKSENNKDKALSIINGIFISDINSLPNDSKHLCLAISLKEQYSKHGKAKSYINVLNVKNEYYNLTTGEKSIKDNEKILEEIIKIRKWIRDNADKNIFDYKIGGKDINNFEGKNYLAKYASLKMIKFFIEHFKDNPNVFSDIVSYGLSLLLNPVFFKLTGNIYGDEKLVKYEKFEEKGNVTLCDIPDISYDKKIWIIDNPKNSGIQLVYWVLIMDKLFYVEISIRSSSGEGRASQITIEIDKLKELDKSKYVKNI